MHKLKWLRLGAVGVALCLGAVSGCGGSSSQSSGGTAAQPSGGNAGQSGAAGSIKPRTIGWVDGVLAGSFQTRLHDVAAQAIKSLGWQMKTVDLAGDGSKASSGVSGLVAQHVDAILMSAVTPSTARAGLLQAKSAGIPVLIVGSEPGENDLVKQLGLPYVGESEAGLSGPLIDLMKKHLSSGDEVGVLYTTALASSTIRTDTVVKALKDAGTNVIPPVETGFNFSDGQKSAAALINQHPKMKVIVSIYDLWTAATVAAIKASRRSDISVYSYYADAVNNPLMKANPKVVLGLADGNMINSPLEALGALLAHFQKGEAITTSGVSYNYVAVTPDTVPAGDQNGPVSFKDALAPFYKSWSADYGVSLG